MAVNSMAVIARYMMKMMILLLLASTGTVDAAKRRQARPARRQIEPRTGPTDEQVWDTGLIEKELSYINLLERGREHYQDTESRRFKNFVLGYVTPWNRAGYTNAVTFRRKLDAVSPVWFQIRQQEGQKAPDILGAHEVNQTWISELRKGPGAPLVVPRFIVEAEPLQHVEMLQNPTALLEAIGNTVSEHGFDGLVLETWSAWHSFNGLANERFRAAALSVLEALGQMLQAQGGKKLFLAVPPMYPANEKSPWIDTADVQQVPYRGRRVGETRDKVDSCVRGRGPLSKFVDGFSVMTYDFSTVQGRAGPNAPIDWVKLNVHLPAGQLPRCVRPLPPSARPGRNFSTFDGALQDREGFQHTVWYPTPRALEMRLQEYVGRILNGAIVHTGANTEMALTTHHTLERPQFPPGTIRGSCFTQPQYVPTEDPALDHRGLAAAAAGKSLHTPSSTGLEGTDKCSVIMDTELHAVAHAVSPLLPALLEACRAYHLHSPDGWITTAGFMTAAKRAGLELSRAEYLALERALLKDVRGRINYLQVEQLVTAIMAGDSAAAAAAAGTAESSSTCSPSHPSTITIHAIHAKIAFETL
ncbi:hypothetical protein VOLCADRAFT_108109 [Volvox carteri f. nagariensis]|uniref:GH18 domain-containing protein n=1 Tax=Volvox carteri f. nagariensis TaxID=3068 RepID=D8UIA1_VOLCA|nr:uncharacterized protein VOLCADRAFT_108109 [Volvox carteri f. nagariensis]EFJ40529.1 hypothetical protein VOLCADRAFT_108109 [Volvox carteri f. nagariensis]|eukprot:XP_002958379.1 hypothetical protein VOLCADRAFT_108109 [Volvox carteri f. nagariensis]